MAKRKPGPGVGQAIGGILVGFDHQVFRSTPPPHELVQKGKRLPAVPAEGGGTLTIGLPGEDAAPPGEADDDSSRSETGSPNE